MDVALPHGPDFFQFGTPERMVAALTEVGFIDPAAYSFSQDWRVANADRYIDSLLSGTVRAGAALASQSGATAADVHSYIANYLTRFRTPTGEFGRANASDYWVSGTRYHPLEVFVQLHEVRCWPKADTPVGDSRGSFRGESGHPTLAAPRQLMTQTGHPPRDFVVTHNTGFP